MAKTRTRTKPKPAKRIGNPNEITYQIKKMDRHLWERFSARAKTEGHSKAWVLADFVSRYAEGA